MSIFGLSNVELQILAMMLLYGVLAWFVYFFLDLKKEGMKEGLVLDVVLITFSVVPLLNVVAAVKAAFDLATATDEG